MQRSDILERVKKEYYVELQRKKFSKTVAAKNGKVFQVPPMPDEWENITYAIFLRFGPPGENYAHFSSPSDCAKQEVPGRAAQRKATKEAALTRKVRMHSSKSISSSTLHFRGLRLLTTKSRPSAYVMHPGHIYVYRARMTRNGRQPAVFERTLKSFSPEQSWTERSGKNVRSAIRRRRSTVGQSSSK